MLTSLSELDKGDWVEVRPDVTLNSVFYNNSKKIKKIPKNLKQE